MQIESKEALTSQIEASKAAGNTLIVKFGANWCGPCRALDPTLAKIETENTNVDVASIDVDSNSELSVEFEVRSIPAVFIYKDGVVTDSFVGNKSAVDILKLV